MSSDKAGSRKKPTKREAMSSDIAKARLEAEQTEAAARAAKSDFKRARKTYKQVRKEAKAARKSLKTLARKLKKSTGKKPRDEKQKAGAPGGKGQASG